MTYFSTSRIISDVFTKTNNKKSQANWPLTNHLHLERQLKGLVFLRCWLIVLKGRSLRHNWESIVGSNTIWGENTKLVLDLCLCFCSRDARGWRCWCWYPSIWGCPVPMMTAVRRLSCGLSFWISVCVFAAETRDGDAAARPPRLRLLLDAVRAVFRVRLGRQGQDVPAPHRQRTGTYICSCLMPTSTSSLMSVSAVKDKTPAPHTVNAFKKLDFVIYVGPI